MCLWYKLLVKVELNVASYTCKTFKIMVVVWTQTCLWVTCVFHCFRILVPNSISATKKTPFTPAHGKWRDFQSDIHHFLSFLILISTITNTIVLVWFTWLHTTSISLLPFDYFNNGQNEYRNIIWVWSE